MPMSTIMGSLRDMGKEVKNEQLVNEVNVWDDGQDYVEGRLEGRRGRWIGQWMEDASQTGPAGK